MAAIPARLRRPARAPEPRPRRGTPDATRARLITTATEVFNRDGYDGTDSNRLARAAGYAPATFYKHFPDKRALFLAVYEQWVAVEWAEIGRIVRDAENPRERAARIVDLSVDHHRRWRGLRASLRALVASDAEARAFYRTQRRRQLALMAALRARQGGKPSEDDAVLLYTMERTCDALADGEIRELGLAVGPVLARLRALVLERFS